jgi:cell division protein FtsQ
VLALVALLALFGGIWLWLRDSSLVGVRRVSVTGASGADAGQIRSALKAAARGMTTLDVNMKDLRTAVAPYPVVKTLQVDTQFPHGMRIRVVEQVPVAIIDTGGRRTAVAGDGTLLHDVAASSALPVITLAVVPGGTHVTGYVLSEVQLLAAAPYALLAKVASVSDANPHGLEVKLRNGPDIYFGDSTQPEAKWTAAAEVLGDGGSAGATYIDVTVPSRPVAGVGADAAATSGAGATGSGATASGTSTAATAGAATDPAANSSTASAATTTAPSTAGTVTGTAAGTAGVPAVSGGAATTGG